MNEDVGEFQIPEGLPKTKEELAEILKYRVELSDVSIDPLFNEPFRYVHPAIDVVDGVAYVGVMIPCQIRDAKRRETVKDMLALVTCDRRLILRHKEVLAKEKIRLRHDIPKVMSRWSLKSVKAWLDGNAEVDPLDVYMGVKTVFEEYIELEDDTTYDFLTLWAIGTYFFHLFPAYPYIYVGGIKQTGKTKLLNILERICFNAKNSLDITESALFRNVEIFRLTLLIDEADILDNPERRQSIRKLLWGGYKRGSLVNRTNPNTLQPEWFEVYSPKAIANIKGVEDVLEDRCIVLIMKRGKRKEIINKEIPFEAEFWQRIRDMLYVFYLTYFSELSELSELSEGGKGGDLERLSGRELELWKPILTLALFFDKHIEGLYSRICDFALKKSGEKLVENVTETAEYILAQVLLRLVKSDGFYKVKDLRDAIAQSYDEEQKWLTTKWVGNALKRLGFTEKRRVGTGIEYRLTLSQVQDLAERLGIEKAETEKGEKATSELSELSGLSEHAKGGSVEKETATISEVYDALRKQLTEPFYDSRAIELIMKIRLCDISEAERLFKVFVDEGKLVKDAYGLWHWTSGLDSQDVIVIDLTTPQCKQKIIEYIMQTRGCDLSEATRVASEWGWT
jgi:hypothetical protein